jgi:hypothetical protein
MYSNRCLLTAAGYAAVVEWDATLEAVHVRRYEVADLEGFNQAIQAVAGHWDASTRGLLPQLRGKCMRPLHEGSRGFSVAELCHMSGCVSAIAQLSKVREQLLMKVGVTSALHYPS